jgi:hypothetical protein
MPAPGDGESVMSGGGIGGGLDHAINDHSARNA